MSLFKSSGAFGRQNTGGASVWLAQAARQDHLVSEQAFGRLLDVEKKRAVRSRRAFALVLLDLEAFLCRNGGTAICEAVGGLVSSCRRETDFCGWFKKKTKVGLILTEIGVTSKGRLEALILGRLKTALCARLNQEQIDQIRMSVHLFPDDWAPGDGQAGKGARLGPAPELLLSRNRASSSVIKRAIDVIGSLLALLCLSPLFLAIAAAIKLTSKGPVLFRQTRIGQCGVPFSFLKFRSMYVHNDSMIHREYVKQFIEGKNVPAGSAEPMIYKIIADPRVTPVGRVLRRSSLDELPQLWNVLKGEMSLVGPRPPIPYELSSYDLWHKRRLLEVKPGITGLWQVSGRSQTTFDEMVRLDLRYAMTWSLRLDLTILWETPRAVFSATGAY